MEFINWMCNDCFIVMEAADEGQAEECPRCGREMDEVFIEEET